MADTCWIVEKNENKKFVLGNVTKNSILNCSTGYGVISTLRVYWGQKVYQEGNKVNIKLTSYKHVWVPDWGLSKERRKIPQKLTITHGTSGLRGLKTLVLTYDTLLIGSPINKLEVMESLIQGQDLDGKAAKDLS